MNLLFILSIYTVRDDTIEIDSKLENEVKLYTFSSCCNSGLPPYNTMRTSEILFFAENLTIPATMQAAAEFRGNLRLPVPSAGKAMLLYLCETAFSRHLQTNSLRTCQIDKINIYQE